MSKETTDILRRARALIDTPEKWTKDVLARDADGNQCDARSTDAKCYCIEGALLAACHELGMVFSTVMPFYRAIRLATPISRSVPDFNDREETTHADVLAIFDRAIATEDAND